MKTLFLDIGGVLLTNGWDHKARDRAISRFALDEHEVNSRHSITFDTLEIGKITLDEYINRTIFYKPQAFSKEEFITFMQAQSEPYQDMITLCTDLKKAHNLKVVAVSNEARELTEYRIKTFKLDALFDIFVVSCYVHLRKPDIEMYKMALDLSNCPANEVVYIEDRPLLAEVAKSLGIHAICHKEIQTTSQDLRKLL